MNELTFKFPVNTVIEMNNAFDALREPKITRAKRIEIVNTITQIFNVSRIEETEKAKPATSTKLFALKGNTSGRIGERRFASRKEAYDRLKTLQKSKQYASLWASEAKSDPRNYAFSIVEVTA